jgi:hypothetical protein
MNHTFENYLQDIDRHSVFPTLRRDAELSHLQPFRDEDLFVQAYRENVSDLVEGWQDLVREDCSAFKNGGPLPQYIAVALGGIYHSGK